MHRRSLLRAGALSVLAAVARRAFAIGGTGGAPMSDKRVEDIWRIAAFDQAIHAQVAWELVASWPVPVRKGAEVGFLFFYYAAFGPPPAKAFKLWPPSWIVSIARDGAVSDLHRITPQDSGLSVPAGDPYAEFSWPASWGVEDADRKRLQLLESYDGAVVSWGASGSAPAGKSADAFRHRFLEVTPSALLPCYRKWGDAFFVWAGI